jgi:hypothetical protein
MKVNEIRIGNWFMPENPSKVIGISFSTLFQEYGAAFDNNRFISIERGLEPIKITLAILRKLGFEDWGRVDLNDYEFYQRFVLYNTIDGTSNFEVHLITSSYENKEHKQTVFSIDKDDRIHLVNAEYLHNLQNAFYFASGYELDTTTLITQ